MIRRIAVAMALVAGAGPVAAQTPGGPTSGGPPVEFMPRTAFHMDASHLSGDDPRFVWEANFGGELDVIDWGRGRATFLANYEVVMGDEFKVFDPNQGNYVLAGSGWVRLRGLDVGGVFHHESRHLSDRYKRQAVDWNMVGVAAERRLTAGVFHLNARGDVRRVIQKSLVDYEWEARGRLRADVVAYPGVGALVAVDVQVLGVDGTRGRGTQSGVRAEGGLRLDGRAGAVELFVAAERRVDPYPLQFGTADWVIAGFRLLSR